MYAYTAEYQNNHVFTRTFYPKFQVTSDTAPSQNHDWVTKVDQGDSRKFAEIAESVG